MLRYGSFYEKKYGSFATTPPITGKVSVLEFVEVLKKEGAGRRTRQTLLYALDWFSVILAMIARESGTPAPRGWLTITPRMHLPAIRLRTSSFRC